MKRIFILFLFIFACMAPKNVFAKDISVTGSYGLTICDQNVTNNTVSNCAYKSSYAINSNSTYTVLSPANISVSGGSSFYSISNAVWLFPSGNFQAGNTYTLKFGYDHGLAVYNNFHEVQLSDILIEYQQNGQYYSGGYKNLTFSQTYNAGVDPNTGVLTLSFQASTNATGYRIRFTKNPYVLRNESTVYNQGFRFVSISAVEDTDPSLPLLNGILGQQQQTNDKLDILNEKQQAIKDSLDSVNKNQQETNEKLDDLNSNLTNEDSPDVDGFLDDLKVDDSNSPVSDLITMPLTLMQAYVNGFSSSCSSVSLGNLLGYDLVFPCIDLKNYLGETLFTLIDMLFCLFMVYNIGMMCVSIYESITSLDDNMQLLYSPQHAGNSRVSKGEMEGLY